MTPRAPRARMESIPARWLYHRPLLGRLCQAAYQTAHDIIRVASPGDEGLTPGMIVVVQTFGDDLGWHPHVHALVTRGGWDRAGTWVPVPFVDAEAAALLLGHKVFSFLQAEGLLSEGRVRLLLSWRHSGLRDHRVVVVDADTQPPPAPRSFGRTPCSPRLASHPASARSRCTPRSPCRRTTATPWSASLAIYSGHQ